MSFLSTSGRRPLANFVKPIKSLYLIGSLRNEEIPKIAASLRTVVPDVFDDWHAAGPEADDYWKEYERGRNHTYAEALQGHAAKHVFSFDKYHLDRCDAAVLALPAGKSGHLELGYFIGTGRPGFILLDGQDDRFDVMYQFATKVFHTQEEMIEYFGSMESIRSTSELRESNKVFEGTIYGRPNPVQTPKYEFAEDGYSYDYGNIGN